ncbi:hypothetical protein GF325_03345 [Candidatus Bathyarchaeota archaeon]|nr:hypothetical protein [Candidatus Bathyarchaeota archaeon]
MVANTIIFKYRHGGMLESKFTRLMVRPLDKKIVLIGAGSTAFGTQMFSDLFLSETLPGSTIVLHDINREKLEIVHEVIEKENQIRDNPYSVEWTTDRQVALQDADFIISSIEIGNRMELWRLDREIPRKHGSKQILGECGGPGGALHAFRIIPHVVEIVQDVEKICPGAFFINLSNPLARVCLAIKRATKNLKFVGLCHQITFLNRHLPQMLDKKLEHLRFTVAGLNHFGFLLDLVDTSKDKDLMPEFSLKAMNYFTEHDDRFEFSTLTRELYRRLGYFPHPGDNHIGEYLQFGHEFTKDADMVEWIDLMDEVGHAAYINFKRSYKRLQKGKYLKRGMMLRIPSGERAIPIIESICADSSGYERSVNVPNDGLIDNLPQDLIVEVPGTVDKDGVHGQRIGKLPANIAALLRIEASIQDICVEAVLKRSKDLAIATLATDTNVDTFEMAEAIYREAMEVQEDYMPSFS